MHPSRIELFQGMSLFGGVRDDIVALVLERAAPVTLPPGRYFFREGEPADSLFVLESGTAEVVKGDGSGERVLRTLVRGDCFGELSVMDLAPRSASVRAAQHCVALEVPAACLLDVYAADVEQFAIIEMNMGRELARRLRDRDASAR